MKSGRPVKPEGRRTCSRSLKVSSTWRGDRKLVIAELNLMRDSFFTSISATAWATQKAVVFSQHFILCFNEECVE